MFKDVDSFINSYKILKKKLKENYLKQSFLFVSKIFKLQYYDTHAILK